MIRQNGLVRGRTTTQNVNILLPYIFFFPFSSSKITIFEAFCLVEFFVYLMYLAFPCNTELQTCIIFLLLRIQTIRNESKDLCNIQKIACRGSRTNFTPLGTFIYVSNKKQLCCKNGNKVYTANACKKPIKCLVSNLREFRKAFYIIKIHT